MLFGFALLFPGAAFQNAFAHPISFDIDFWGTLDFDSSKCTEVTVSADITNLKITWYDDENDFDDGVGGYSGAEIEILYKIWEPKHTKEGYGRQDYDSAHQIPNMRYPGKVVSAIQIEDVEFNGERLVKLTDGSGEFGSWPTADIKIQTEWGYTDGFWDRHHIHKKYFHPTCVEDLKELVLAVAVSEIDGGGYLESNKIDALFGGKKMEDEIEKNMNTNPTNELGILIREGREKAEGWGIVSYSGTPIEFEVSPVGRVLVEVVEKVILEAGIEDRLLPKLAQAFPNDRLLKVLADEKLGAKVVGETFDFVYSIGGKKLTGEAIERGLIASAKKGLTKVAGVLLGGPVGWAWFVYDTVSDISDLADFINGPNQFLGTGVWTIPLTSEQVGKGPLTEKIETNFAPAVEYRVPLLYPGQESASIAPITSQAGAVSQTIIKLVTTQFGVAEITFEIEIKRPFCVSPSSSRTPEGAEQSLGQSFNLNDVDTSLDNSDSLKNYVNKQFEMLTNIIQKYNLGEPIEEPQPEPIDGNVGGQTDLEDSAEYELVLHPETGLLINPVTGIIEFFPEQKIDETPQTETGVIPLPEVEPPLRFLKTVDGNSELREDENGDKEAVFNFLILDDKGQPPKSPEITIFQNEEAVLLSENDFSIDDEGWFQYVQNSPGEWIISIADIKTEEENQVFDGSICYEFTEIVPPRDCLFKEDDITAFDSSYSKMNPPIGNPSTTGQTYHVGQGTIQGLEHPQYFEMPSDDFYDPEPILVPYVFVEQKSWFAMRHQEESFVSQYKPDENHAYNDMWAGWRFVYSNGEPASGLYLTAKGVHNENPDSRFGGSGNTDENGFFEISGGETLAGNYTILLGPTNYSDTYANPYILMTHENDIDGSCFNSNMQATTLDQKIVLLSKSGGISGDRGNYEYKLAYEDGEPLKNTYLLTQLKCEKWGNIGVLPQTYRYTLTDEFGVASSGYSWPIPENDYREGCTIIMLIEKLSVNGLPYQAFEQNQEVWEQSLITLN